MATMPIDPSALTGLTGLLAAIRNAFPQARITSGFRGPNNPLTRANPRSMHALGNSQDPRAVDVAPIPGVSFGDYVQAIKKAGVPVAQAYDEATHPFPWTTGPNWHLAQGASSGGHKVGILPRTLFPQQPGQPDPLMPYSDGSGYYPGPNQPEPPTQPVPVPGSPSPSQSAQVTAPVAAKKRGGILGALESVFMPDPGSRWWAALNGGLVNAKATQQAYRENEAKVTTEQQMAEAKLKAYLTKGEYQVVGNNVFHIPADGSAPEMIAPPTNPSETERLIDKWRNEPDPAIKNMLRAILLKGNAPEVLQSHERQASTRAGATVSSARIRANAPSKSSATAKPPAGFILDE